MRNLVYVLILANVVYFLWEMGFRAGEDAEAFRELEIPSGMERIALAGEVAGVPAATPPSAAKPVPQAASPTPMAQPATPPPEPKPEPPKNVDCFQSAPPRTRRRPRTS